MGMSMHVVGIRPADDKYKQMEAVWKACETAKVKIPTEVLNFFANEEPDAKGVIVDISEASEEWAIDNIEGIEVILAKLPPDVKIVRFYNSW